MRGAYVKEDTSLDNLISLLEAEMPKFQAGFCPDFDVPEEKELKAPHHIAIDYGDAAELASKIERAVKALRSDKPGGWRVLNAKGIFYGKGEPGKVAFLFTGQGSQYANMLDELRHAEPIIADTIRLADQVMQPFWANPFPNSFMSTPATLPKWRRPKSNSNKRRSPAGRIDRGYRSQPPHAGLWRQTGYGDGPLAGRPGALVCADVISFGKRPWWP